MVSAVSRQFGHVKNRPNLYTYIGFSSFQTLGGCRKWPKLLCLWWFQQCPDALGSLVVAQTFPRRPEASGPKLSTIIWGWFPLITPFMKWQLQTILWEGYFMQACMVVRTPHRLVRCRSGVTKLPPRKAEVMSGPEGGTKLPPPLVIIFESRSDHYIFDGFARLWMLQGCRKSPTPFYL